MSELVELLVNLLPLLEKQTDGLLAKFLCLFNSTHVSSKRKPAWAGGCRGKR